MFWLSTVCQVQQAASFVTRGLYDFSRPQSHSILNNRLIVIHIALASSLLILKIKAHFYESTQVVEINFPLGSK